MKNTYYSVFSVYIYAGMDVFHHFNIKWHVKSHDKKLVYQEKVEK